MEILDCNWTPKVNILILKCDCGALLSHRTDRWKVICPNCGKDESLQKLRDNYRGRIK